MKFSPFGQTDMSISQIGLGSWAIGGQWEWGWGSQEDQDSIRTIHKALDMGINWIDTAPAYGLGHSERVIAKALAQTDKKPWIFTKCGILWKDDGSNWPEISAENAIKEIEESLSRLNVESIDLYQIHWPIPVDNLEETWAALSDIKAEGKVKHIGVSNCDVAQLQKLNDIAPVATLQPNYSMLVREPEKELLPYCLENNIGVINYSPMGSGLLSGRMTRDRIAALSSDDWRHGHDEFKEPRLSRNLKLVELLNNIAKEHQCNAGSVAVAWCTSHPAISGSIVGLRSETQAEEMAEAGNLCLTAKNIESINTFLNENP